MGELVVVINRLAQATGNDDIVGDEVHIAHLHRRL